MGPKAGNFEILEYSVMRHIENIHDSDESIVLAGNQPMDSLNYEGISIPVESSVGFTSTEESTPKGDDQNNPAKHIDGNRIQFPDGELKDVLKRLPLRAPKLPPRAHRLPPRAHRLPPPAPPISRL